MKKLFIILAILFPAIGGTKENNSITTNIQAKADTLLVYDVVVKDGKLRNYRKPADCLRNIDEFSYIDLHGFAELKISGSAQFSRQKLPYILQHANGKVFIVDLRQESHGFVNGKAVTWFSYRNQINSNKIPEQIYQDEKKLLAAIADNKNITVHEIKKTGDGHFESIKNIEIEVKKVEAEQELVNQFGINYVRFYVLDRHRPNDEQVDAFIDFIRDLPKDAWLHFHCRAGKGRTTTFMVMYDIIHNAKQVRLEDILNRHIELGGSVLDDVSDADGSKWPEEAAIKRYKFIQSFYNYVVASDGYGVKKWSEWIGNISTFDY